MADVNDLNEAHEAGYASGYAAGRAGLEAERKAANSVVCIDCGLILGGELSQRAHAQEHRRVCPCNQDRIALDKLRRIEEALLNAFRVGNNDPEETVAHLIRENLRLREAGVNWKKMGRSPRKRRKSV